MEMKKYILFGAGYYATVAISLLGKENIEFIMDNNRDKAGSSVEGIAVYPYCEKKSQCGHYTIVISVSDRYCPQIEEQLKKDGFKNFLTVGRIQSEQTRKKIEGRFDNISVYKKAIGWIKNNSVDGQAIICNTGKRKGYPEVTGYYIPTLIRWDTETLPPDMQTGLSVSRSRMVHGMILIMYHRIYLIRHRYLKV